MSTAIVIGATGLVGKNVVQQLLADPRFTQVTALVRRATAVRHEKYQEHLVDFGKPEAFAALVKGDVLFSAMGTTRADAGSIEAQRLVDYTYQLEVAKLAARNGMKAYVLCSASSASPTSPIAYSKMKGELERDVKALGFESVQILQPGPLTGGREKRRPGEELGVKVMRGLASIGILRSMRPITGEQVAKAMVEVSTRTGTATYGAGELFALAA
jgi:uncharacterized protein YbjT (DUF2867 family)